MQINEILSSRRQGYTPINISGQGIVDRRPAGVVRSTGAKRSVGEPGAAGGLVQAGKAWPQKIS